MQHENRLGGVAFDYPVIEGTGAGSFAQDCYDITFLGWGNMIP